MKPSLSLCCPTRSFRNEHACSCHIHGVLFGSWPDRMLLQSSLVQLLYRVECGTFRDAESDQPQGKGPGCSPVPQSDPLWPNDPWQLPGTKCHRSHLHCSKGRRRHASNCLFIGTSVCALFDAVAHSGRGGRGDFVAVELTMQKHFESALSANHFSLMCKLLCRLQDSSAQIHTCCLAGAWTANGSCLSLLIHLNWCHLGHIVCVSCLLGCPI